MKIGMLSSDERLIDELTNVVYKQTPCWIVSSSAEELEQELTKDDCAMLVVSDRSLTFSSLEEWVDRYRQLCPEARIIVLLSNYHDAAINEKYVKMCKLKKLDYMLPGRGTAAIADYIRAWVDNAGTNGLQPDANGKMITFVGSTPNIGTTLVSFGTAFAIALESAAQIGYLCLNLKSSKLHRYLGREERVFTLDGLRAELKGQSLTAERLLQVCEKLREAPNLHVLYGNLLREQAEFFTPSEIEHLIRTARSAFDVCIVEVNAYWDNASTVCALLEADSRIVVTTPDITHFQEDLSRWIGQVGAVFGLQSHAFELIAVQMDKQSKEGGFTIKDIRKETQMHILGQVSRHADALSALNRGKLLELLWPGHAFREEVSAIANKFADLYQLPKETNLGKATWLKRFMAGRAAT